MRILQDLSTAATGCRTTKPVAPSESSDISASKPMHHEDLHVAYQLFCKPLCNGCLRMFGSLAGNCTKL